MSFSSAVVYALLCLYYAAWATLRFTVEVLLFLPLYLFVERHDTRSRWLGRRAEAQLQPIVPTAFHYDHAHAEEEDEEEEEGRDEGSSAAVPHAPHDLDERSGPTFCDASSTCVLRCRGARARIGRLRSLRMSAQMMGWSAPQEGLGCAGSLSTPSSSFLSDTSLKNTSTAKVVDRISGTAVNAGQENNRSDVHSKGVAVTDAFFAKGVKVCARLNAEAMRAALPPWCQMRCHFSTAGTTTAHSLGNNIDSTPLAIVGQYGFVPPWYAVHARAQLLWAHIDPLSRMVAEVLCLRGWASSPLPVVTPAETQGRGNVVSVSETSTSPSPPHSFLSVLLHALLAPLRVFGEFLLSVLHRFLLLPDPQPSVLEDGKSITQARLVGSSMLSRLHDALRSSVDGYVADTCPIFEAVDVTSAAMPSRKASVPPPTSNAKTTASAESESGIRGTAYAPKDEVQQKQASATSASVRPVADCQRSLGVYWLHGRRPTHTAGETKATAAAAAATAAASGAPPPPPPVIVLLLCPSLLQGSGLYSYTVARISHICQLLSLAGAWQAPPKAREDGNAGGFAPALWYAAVPVVELRVTTAGTASASKPEDAVSRPPLTLQDLRLVVNHLRALGHTSQQTADATSSATCPPPQQQQKVIVIAVGWSEAASPLIELAMTQQHQQQHRCNPTSSHRSSDAALAHLDGLVCLSHTLSSTFQLLPQQRDASLAVRRSFHLNAPSALTSAEGIGKVGGSGGVHDAESIDHPLSLSAYAHLYTTPHIPRVLAHLTTGPARLLLLLARLQLIADNLVIQRHHAAQSSAEEAAEGGDAPQHSCLSDPLFYRALQRFRDARELANATQRGLDAPTLLWSHAQHRSGARGRRGVAHTSASPPSNRGARGEAHGISRGDAGAVSGPSSSVSAGASVGAGGTASTITALAQHGLQGIPTAAAAAAQTAGVEATTASRCTGRRSLSGAAVLAHFAQRSPPQEQQRQHPQDMLSPLQSPFSGHQATPTAYLSSLPHLETLTDWEELVRSDAMVEMQRQQQREAANTTAAHLPNPPSVDSSMAMRATAAAALAKTSVQQPSESDEANVNSASSSRVMYGLHLANGEKARSTSDVFGVPPAQPSSKVASPLLPAPSPFGQSLRSWQSRMSTEDVVASCTLQCVTPTTRHTTRYPDGGLGSQTPSSKHKGSAMTPSTYSPLLRCSSDVNRKKNVLGSSERTAPCIKGLTVLGDATAVRETDGGSALRDPGTSFDFSTPLSAAPNASSAAPSRLGDDAFFSAAPQPSSTLTDLASVSFGSPCSLARPSSTAPTFQSRSAEVPPPPQQQHKQAAPSSQSRENGACAEHGLVEVLPALSMTDAADTGATAAAAVHADSPLRSSPGAPRNDAIAATFSSCAPSPPPPQSQSPIPYPPPPPSARSRAFTSQAAALVELRVRSAQHAALIQRIRVPTLFLHARDDPVAPPSTVPFTLLQANPWITTVLTRRGSHATYMESAAEVWRRPYLVIDEALPLDRRAKEVLPVESARAEFATRCARVRKQVAKAVDTRALEKCGSSSSRTRSCATDSCSCSCLSQDSDDDFCINSSGDGERAAPLTCVDGVACDTQAPRRRVRVEGTTWVERLLFEYVEQVFLAPAAA